MKIFIKLLLSLVVFSTSLSAYSYVNCSNVDVQVRSAATATYHSFNELGVVKNSVYIAVPMDHCTSPSNEELSGSIYLVLDDIDNAGYLKKFWLSMLLAAGAGGKTISFSAYSQGINSKGFQVLRPYNLYVN